MTLTQSELLATQNNANAQDNSKSNIKQLIQREQIPDTPFWVIGNKETGFFIIMGQHKIVETQKTKAAAIAQLDKDKWRIILRITAIITNDIINENHKQLIP